MSRLGQKIAPAVRRERVLQAALTLFVDKGYFNTTIPQICRSSKVSTGAVYNYFKNKEEIAVTLFVENLNRFNEALHKQLAKEETTEAKVRTMVHFMLHSFEENPILSRYLFMAPHNEFIQKGLPSLKKSMRGYFGQELNHMLKIGIANGTIRKMPVDVVRTIVIGLPIAYAERWLNGAFSLPPSKVSQAITEAVWKALQA